MNYSPLVGPLPDIASKNSRTSPTLTQKVDLKNLITDFVHFHLFSRKLFPKFQPSFLLVWAEPENGVLALKVLINFLQSFDKFND
jgi:hypothetical protein